LNHIDTANKAAVMISGEEIQEYPPENDWGANLPAYRKHAMLGSVDDT